MSRSVSVRAFRGGGDSYFKLNFREQENLM